MATGRAAPGAVRGVLAALSLAMLLSSLGTSIANVGLPDFAEAFGARFQAVQWIVLAYLLSVTALIVTVGRLGDRLGRRRLLMGGFLIFTFASALCGLAPTLGVLITGRAAQGVGAAAMMAMSMALIGETLPKSKTGSAMGLLGTMSAIGTALGPSLGGVLIAAWGWPAVFLIKVPLGALGLILAHRYLPADHRDGGSAAGKSDPVGALLLAGALVAYALAMTPGRGHFGPSNLALLGAAGLGGGLFVAAERRVRAPLVRLGMLRDVALRAGLATSTLVSTVIMVTLVVGPFYLSRGLGLDAAGVGLVMSVGPLVAALTGAPAGRVVDRSGPGRMAVAGLTAMAGASLLLATLPRTLGVPGYVAPLVVMTAGYALFQAANNTAVLSGAEESQRGVVSGLLNLSRNIGLISGASVMGAVFAWASGAPDVTSASATDIGGGMRTTFAVAAAVIVTALGIAVHGAVSTASPTEAGSGA